MVKRVPPGDILSKEWVANEKDKPPVERFILTVELDIEEFDVSEAGLVNDILLMMQDYVGDNLPDGGFFHRARVALVSRTEL